MTQHPHPLSPTVPIHHAGFTDLNGDTWHHDAFAGVWSSESGDEPDPQALLTEISSLRSKLRHVYAWIKGVQQVVTHIQLPEDFPK